MYDIIITIKAEFKPAKPEDAVKVLARRVGCDTLAEARVQASTIVVPNGYYVARTLVQAAK